MDVHECGDHSGTKSYDSTSECARTSTSGWHVRLREKDASRASTAEAREITCTWSASKRILGRHGEQRAET